MGKLFVITGPSGAGKDSVIYKAKELGLDFEQVITTSTREIRNGESESHPYHFISTDDFKGKIENEEMIEWAEVYGNYYGSTKEEVDKEIEMIKMTYKDDPNVEENLTRADVIETLAVAVQNRKVVKWLREKVLKPKEEKKNK